MYDCLALGMHPLTKAFKVGVEASFRLPLPSAHDSRNTEEPASRLLTLLQTCPPKLVPELRLCLVLIQHEAGSNLLASQEALSETHLADRPP